MTVNAQPLDTLANELWNFLGDATDHGLPPLWSVQLERSATDRGWRARARVDGTPDDSTVLYEAISAYARYWGVRVEFGKPYPVSSVWASRSQRKLTVSVSYMGVAIELYTLVDGAFERPSDPYAESVYAVGPFAGLVLGEETGS